MPSPEFAEGSAFPARPVPVRPPTVAGRAASAGGSVGGTFPVSEAPVGLDVDAARRRSAARRRPAADPSDAARLPPAGGSRPGNPVPSVTSENTAEPTPPARPGRTDGRPKPADDPAGEPGPAQAVNVQAVRGRPGGFAPKLNKHVCPFCGTKRDDVKASCPGCGMSDDAETRAATTSRIGPWFVLQPRNPAAPGMRFAVLKELVRHGQVTAGTIVRGPTTQQLWTYAGRTRGLAHLFGVCWSCSRGLPRLKPDETPDDFCVYCGALLDPPSNPDQQLEMLGVPEAAGVAPDAKASQAHVEPDPDDDTPHTVPTVEIRQTASRALPAVRPVRRLPRPIPAAPADADDDALLTTRELATAFNLDRRNTVWSAAAKLPWGTILGMILLALVVIAGLYVASGVFWQPARDVVNQWFGQ